MDEVKACTVCKIEKSAEDFYSNKSHSTGLSSWCRACTRDRVKRYRKNNAGKVKKAKKSYYESNKEKLLEQQKLRPRDYKAEYLRYRNRVGCDQYKAECRERSDRYRKRNRQKVNMKARLYRRKNLDHHKARLEEYRSRPEYPIRRKELYQINIKRERARSNRYRAKKLRATPAWADQEKIEDIYQKCIEISEQTGIPHEVDHIVPLQSKLVCGLHCEQNLQIITASENRSKNNLWWPDMPIEVKE